MLDADISDFVTSLDHGWLQKFVEHRIVDKRILRLIQKWVGVGVIEDGAWTASDVGTPQGASVSPLLANIYLHYVFDRRARQWRCRNAGGDMVIVGFADDLVAGFEHQADAQRFLADLRDRASSGLCRRCSVPCVSRCRPRAGLFTRVGAIVERFHPRLPGSTSGSALQPRATRCRLFPVDQLIGVCGVRRRPRR